MKKMIIALGVGLVFTIISEGYLFIEYYSHYYGIATHYSLVEFFQFVAFLSAVPTAVSLALLYSYRSQVVSLMKLNIDETDEEDAQATKKVLLILSSVFLGVLSGSLYYAYSGYDSYNNDVGTLEKISGVFSGVINGSFGQAFDYSPFFTALIRVVLTVVAVFGVYTLLQRSNADSDSDF